MKVSPVHYYYKDSATGVEMNFSKYSDFGWTVGFLQVQPGDAFFFEGDIPWPTLSAEDQTVVDENYKKLRKMMEEDDE